MRSRRAMVFLHFKLWAHVTALENIIEAPVHVLGVAHRAGMYPSQLSGGEQQRVAIARALEMEPEVMVSDEPTSALDPELVGEVLKIMRDLAAEGRTMLVVTHAMGLASEVSNHLVFLHQGRVEEAGVPRDVLANPASARLRQFLAGKLKQLARRTG